MNTYTHVSYDTDHDTLSYLPKLVGKKNRPFKAVLGPPRCPCATRYRCRSASSAPARGKVDPGGPWSVRMGSTSKKRNSTNKKNAIQVTIGE